MQNYIGLIHKEDNRYGIMFPDFPGCISVGNAIADVIRNGTEALAFHVEGMRADGEVVPAPRDVDQIRKEDKWVDWNDSILTTVLLMPAPDIKERVQLSIASYVLMHVDAVTKNRSAFFEKAVRQALNGEYHKKEVNYITSKLATKDKSTSKRWKLSPKGKSLGVLTKKSDKSSKTVSRRD